MKVCPYSPDEMKAAALNVANEFRTSLGLPTVAELSPGHPGSYFSCAIAATVDEDGTYEVLNHDTKKVSIKRFDSGHRVHDRTVENEAAWWFVQQFDSKCFPELIAS